MRGVRGLGVGGVQTERREKGKVERRVDKNGGNEGKTKDEKRREKKLREKRSKEAKERQER